MAVILFNKWILAYSGFKYPIALTLCVLAIAFNLLFFPCLKLRVTLGWITFASAHPIDVLTSSPAAGFTPVQVAHGFLHKRGGGYGEVPWHYQAPAHASEGIYQ